MNLIEAIVYICISAHLGFGKMSPGMYSRRKSVNGIHFCGILVKISGKHNNAYTNELHNVKVYTIQDNRILI